MDLHGKKNLMNLLIIGGSGLLGGRLYKHFKEKQYNVKILVRKNKKKYRNFFPDDILKIDFYNLNEPKMPVKTGYNYMRRLKFSKLGKK